MNVLTFLSDNPMLRLSQVALLALAVVAVFLVFFTTRDVILRSRSFFFQFLAIMLTALLPVIGFFIYLLIRPSRTLKEREVEAMLKEVLEKKGKPQHADHDAPKDLPASSALQ